MKNVKSIIFAILAASFYALSSPISKILLNEISSIYLAGFLYLGAGIGMLILDLVTFKFRKTQYEKFNKKDLIYIVLMVVLDILAPIFLLIGLSKTSAESIALINNFEIVATSIIALIIFKERISLLTFFGLIIVTISTILLNVDFSSLSFSSGALFALMACLCWGVENNCTRKLSNKNPYHIVIIKGICSGSGSFIIALIKKDEVILNNTYIIYALLLGFIAYGLSVFFYVLAQKGLGAAKTSAYYAINPFLGSLLSLALFKEVLNYIYFISLALMFTGCSLITIDTLKKKKETTNT